MLGQTFIIFQNYPTVNSDDDEDVLLKLNLFLLKQNFDKNTMTQISNLKLNSSQLI